MTSNQVKKLFSGELAIEYGQFYVDFDRNDDYLDPGDAFADQNNGLCGAAQSGGLFLVTGIQNGIAQVIVELLESAPPLDSSFQDIVEASFEAPQAQLLLCEWAHENTHQLDLPPGSYRVRYGVLGMDRDYGDDDDWESPVPGQRYLLQFWPGQVTGDEIVTSDSEAGRYWHREWGSG